MSQTKELIEGITALNNEMLAVHGEEIRLINTFGESMHLAHQRTVQALQRVSAQAGDNQRAVMAELEYLRDSLHGGIQAPTQLHAPAFQAPTSLPPASYDLPPLERQPGHFGGEEYGTTGGASWREAAANIPPDQVPTMRQAPQGFQP